MAASLDTLKAAKRLKDAGVPEAHAEAVVETLREAQEAGAAQLATKADLAQVRSELKAYLAEFRAELKKVAAGK